MNPSNIILPLSIITLVTPTLFAQGPPPRGPRPMPPLLRALDQDEDGTISESEIKKSAKALGTLDANTDGKLTVEELRPPRPEGGDERPHHGRPSDEEHRPEDAPQGPPPSPVLKAIDTDHDGTISAEELEGAPKALASLDTDKDGTLTHHEIAPPRPHRGQGPEGDGPPPGGPHGDEDAPPRPPHGGGPRGEAR